MTLVDALEQCGVCERATDEPADWYTPWGSASHDPPEPYDPVPLCAKCAERECARFVGWFLDVGLAPYHARPYWQSPAAWFRAKAIVRGLWRHGVERPVRHDLARYEVRNTLKVRFCVRCGRPEKHPCHGSDTRRVGVRFCWFEPFASRNLGRAEQRDWCSCGFDTGWAPMASMGTRTERFQEHARAS